MSSNGRDGKEFNQNLCIVCRSPVPAHVNICSEKCEKEYSSLMEEMSKESVSASTVFKIMKTAEAIEEERKKLEEEHLRAAESGKRILESIERLKEELRKQYGDDK